MTKAEKAVRVLKEQGIGRFLLKCLVFVWDTTKYALIGLRARALYGLYRVRWGSSLADPDKLIYINPADVRDRLFPPFHPVYIAAGDWDLADGAEYRRRLPLKDMAVQQLLNEHFRLGVPWESTELYHRALAQPDKPRTDYPDERYATEESLKAMFTHLDRIYEDMRANGYRTQEQLGGERRHEVTVNIARDGSYIWNGTGQHRLAMAQLLELKQMPVRILVRHKEWQGVRHAFARGDGDRDPWQSHKSHPDLQEFNAG